MWLRHRYILAIFAGIFFLIYSYVAFVSPPKFVSPDELTNYFFINLYSQKGELVYSEDVNEIAQGIIHPRGTLYLDEKVVPQKFVGFSVIGGTVGVVSLEVVRFITPFLAIVGALFLYLLVRDLFNKKVALVSFLLVLILPPYWYWSSLSMFENIAGCVMLIISFRYFFKLLNVSKPRDYLLSGLFFGLSLFIRPECILFALPLLIIFLWNRRQIKKAYAGLTVLSFIVALGPFFILNNELYGSYLLTGQHMIYQWSQAIPTTSFSLANLLENSLNLVNLTPLLFLCSLLGLLYCIKKRVYLQYIVFFVVCLLAISFYFLSDRTLPTSIHSSYVRYLLPIYMLSLPFISYFIFSLRQKFVGVLLVIVILVTNAFTVIPAINNNLESVEGYARLNSEVVSVTEPDAVIFLDYWDKAIFPERRVGLVKELPEENRSKILAEIVMKLSERNVPVYLQAGSEFRKLIDYKTIFNELSAKEYTLLETEVKNLYELEKLQEE